MRTTSVIPVRVKLSLLTPLMVAAARTGVSRNRFCARALREAVLRELKGRDRAQKQRPMARKSIP